MEEKKQYTGEDRRKDFRVSYPESHRPKLLLRSEKHDILDIAEHGIRFYYSEVSKLHSGKHLLQNVTARIDFNSGKALDVKGDIYRIEEDSAVLFVVKGIPSEIIKEELKAL